MKIFNGSFLLIGACYLCGSAFAVEGKCLTEYGKKKKEEVLLNKKSPQFKEYPLKNSGIKSQKLYTEIKNQRNLEK